MLPTNWPVRLALVLTLAAPLPAAAQRGVELTPFIGSYYSPSHLAEGTDANTNNPLTLDQDNAFSFGGRISVPLGNRLAVEGSFTYTTSGVRVTEKDLLGPGIDGGAAQNGNLIYGSLRAIIQPRRSNLFLYAGPGVVKRGGDAWQGGKSSDLTDFGGVVGLGIRANVTPKFRLTLNGESFLYSFNGSGSNSKFQADLLFTVGVPITIGGK